MENIGGVMEMILFIKNSVPLKQAGELNIGEEYFDEAGHCYEYLGNTEFDFIKQSPLHFGERLVDIEKPEVLRLFWILSSKM
jgi:hypothetical protein